MKHDNKNIRKIGTMGKILKYVFFLFPFLLNNTSLSEIARGRRKASGVKVKSLCYESDTDSFENYSVLFSISE